ncbi:Uncharacterised protein [Bordetella pertussis]|nr:Uncharacterised protein [Bordetella pertussis]
MHALGVPCRARQVTARRPAAVAIHDDGYVPGDVPRFRNRLSRTECHGWSLAQGGKQKGIAKACAVAPAPNPTGPARPGRRVRNRFRYRHRSRRYGPDTSTGIIRS